MAKDQAKLLSYPFECVAWEGDSAVPVFYVPPWDETMVSEIYAYDAEGKEDTLSCFIPPNFSVLGIEGELAYMEVEDKFKDEKPIEPKSKEWRWVMRVQEFTLYNDHEPWYKGTPEIYTRVVYDKGWNWYYFDSREPTNGTGSPKKNVPGDNKWDIFMEVDEESKLYDFHLEWHYHGYGRVIYAGIIKPKYRLEVREADWGVWPDNDDMVEKEDFEDSEIWYYGSKKGTKLKIKQKWEYRTPWNPDNFPND